ncbi:syntaxin-17 [Sitodiplosis mosellana]|uniref:syntaxin-17 n=1 Tax=Sitodiplosis mosellana TaxID=263140 RepID=UPI002444D603|nr:syntaxin-17 [Sitodiplosis mosellana]
MDSCISIKRAEISIKKFNDVGLPHHLGLLKNHKSNIEKSLALGDLDKVKKEEINATRVIKQLKNLMLEMDILRGNVKESDLDRFDELTMPGRQKAKDAIQEYLDLQLKKSIPNAYAPSSNFDYPEDGDNREQGLSNLPQLQTEFELNEHQLRSREACLNEFENLQREIEDIQELFVKLNGSVVGQKEDVQAVETNVIETHEHVEAAEKSLRQALTYKKAMYPLCGAVLGFCVAGPVGMVTFGLKAGSLAAFGGGLLGVTGGTVLKNKQEPEPGPNIDEKEATTID